MLELRSMKASTTGEDIFKEVEKIFNDVDLNWSKLLSVTTDGCPSLTGKNKGLMTRIKNKINEGNPDQQLYFFHCIIHQQVLCKNILELDDVLKTVTRIINYIRSSGLNTESLFNCLKN